MVDFLIFSAIISEYEIGGQVVSHFVDRINAGEFENNVPFSKDTREAYRAEERRVTQLFREEAIKDVGLDDYKLKDRVFDKAWSDGHSYGYTEVYWHLVDLVRLVIE